MPRLAPGDTAPDFTLPDATGSPVALVGLRGSKVVVFFYPAASTPGCTTEACDFRDRLEPLQRNGFVVIGISPDAPEKLVRFAAEQQLTYPLLSDAGRETLTAWGAYGDKQLYGKTVTGVIRSTVVLDEQGVVTWARYNVRATGHVAMLARELGLPAA